MQSTGQALRHRVQPMHQASSMTRQRARPLGAAFGIERQRRPAGDARQPDDAFGAAGRAVVDRRPRRAAIASA